MGPESQKMEEMTKEEMVTMARNAFTLAAEIFNFFHSAVKKTSKPKMVVVQEQASGNESGQATKTNQSKGKANKPITKDAEKKTPSTKVAKKSAERSWFKKGTVCKLYTLLMLIRKRQKFLLFMIL